ncbi:hypothetical protein F4Y93_04520 [Candidatus Poribacteria bacterium]|nr:hypothetical protein [Candidatus Poribacteria bacterium]
MKQFTNTEKEQLKEKIKAEQERQQTLRETNPDLPQTFEAATEKTRRMRRFVPKDLWKYGFLVILLCLLVLNLLVFFEARDFGSDKLINLNLLIALMLLFNHIAFNFTKTGRKSRVMKIVAFAWIVLVFIYLYISWGT